MSGAEVRFGEADLTTCDREPIHIPGSIQPHGVLLVVARGQCLIEQVAGDTRTMLGIDPEHLPGMPLSALLNEQVASQLAVSLASESSFVAPLMCLGVGSVSGKRLLDLSMHAAGDTAIIELEATRRSTTRTDEPVAKLKSMLAAVQHASSLHECCTSAAIAMRLATAFDRAMVYRFLPDGSGVVIAESASPGLESFLGLHYPASDIPQQARELYRRNWLRAIPNVDYVPAPLRPEHNARTARPLDMSHCDLRSVSPIHLEYLRNMGVCASLSASIICRNELWGMLVLHHYSPHHVAADVRVSCETFAQILSLHVEAKVQAETAEQRAEKRGVRDEVIRRLTNASDTAGVLASCDLAKYLGAGGAAVCLDGHLHLVGETPTAAQVTDLVGWLNTINRPLFVSEHLAADYAPAVEFAALASGLVAAGLSRLPRDYLLWFRPEMGLTVRWAGDPAKPAKSDRHGTRLTPRGSFKEWLQVTRMHSAPWTEVDIEAAEALRIVLLENVLKNLDLARRERDFEQARIMAEQLETRVAQRTEQLRALAADLEAAEDRERRQIARDLHDDLGQTLAAARIRLAGLCQHEQADVRAAAAAVDSLVERGNMAVRSLAAQLAPDLLQELGLLPALEWLGEEIERTFGIVVSIADDGLAKPLAPPVRSILYRAVRELLINVAKHARTDSAGVTSQCESGRVFIKVSDMGVGFDILAISRSSRRPLGLISLRERLSYIGGTFEICSTPGTGTTVIMTAPLVVPA